MIGVERVTEQGFVDTLLDLVLLNDFTYNLMAWIEKELSTSAEDTSLEKATSKTGLEFKLVLQVSSKTS